MPGMKGGWVMCLAAGVLLAACERAGAPQPGASAAAPQGMVLIPAGSFVMGSDKTDTEGLQGRYGFTRPLFVNEHPRHSVQLPAFYIDKYEVGNADYKAFVRATGYPEPVAWTQNAYNLADDKLRGAHVDNLRWIAADYFRLDKDTSKMDKDALLADLLAIQRHRDLLPVTEVSWYDAYNYCRWAGKRLPSEAEWEKAARGPDGREYPWGEEWAIAKTSSGEQSDGEDVLAPRGAYPGDISYYGVYDLGGNVSEWVADWYQPYPGADARDPAFGERDKVVKGGGAGVGHYSLSVFFRSARRAHLDPGQIGTDVGFRCAQDAGAE